MSIEAINFNASHDHYHKLCHKQCHGDIEPRNSAIMAFNDLRCSYWLKALQYRDDNPFQDDR